MQPSRLLCPWDFPGKNTGVGCHSLLQGILWIHGSNPFLLHWQVNSLLLSHQGSLWNPYLPASTNMTVGKLASCLSIKVLLLQNPKLLNEVPFNKTLCSSCSVIGTHCYFPINIHLLIHSFIDLLIHLANI